MNIEMELGGIDALGRVLDALTSKSLLSVGKGAETAAMGNLVRSIKQTSMFNDRTGLLRKAQGQKPWRKKNYQVAIVGARIKVVGKFKGKDVVPWRYEHLVHDGHEIYTRSSGKRKWDYDSRPYGHRVEPRRFHEDAWNKSKSTVATVFVNEFKTRWNVAVAQAVSEAGAKT